MVDSILRFFVGLWLYQLDGGGWSHARAVGSITRTGLL